MTAPAHTLSKWDQRFLAMARHISGWSRDPSTKVGCVLVNRRNIVVGLGFNGFPRGVADLQDRYIDRSVKYLMVKHAEENAVLNSIGDLQGATAYVTHPSCSQCTGTLIQAGIKRIVTASPTEAMRERFADSFKAAAIMAREAGVTMVEVDGI